MEKILQRRTIDAIVARYSLEKIEGSLVKLFLDKNNIAVRNNSFVLEMLKQADDRLISTLEPDITEFDIRHFVRIFEILIPKNDRKLNGAFFTPANITEFMVSLVDIDSSKRYLDPSCGCGAFLLELALELRRKTNRSITEIIASQLYGLDIAAYSIRRAKALLSLLALSFGEDGDIAFHLECVDSLSVNAKETFNQADGFDVIIGNPPYVKYQDLPEDKRLSMSNGWKTVQGGNFNLYFPFIEIGADWMKPDGKLVYITPNNYFTSLAGRRLREHLSENRLLDTIIDFGHLKVFSVLTYTAITVLSHSARQDIRYGKVESRDVASHLLENKSRIIDSTISRDNLHDDKWRLLRNIDQKNIRQIESTGTPLGALFDIRVGIATLADKLYFVGPDLVKNFGGRQYEIEKELTVPLRKISDLKEAPLPYESPAFTRRIIFPYKRVNGKAVIFSPEEMEQLYPKGYTYLRAIKDELRKRNKGTLKLKHWYGYGRSQALNFTGPRIYTPTFSNYPRFILDKDKEALFCNGYALFEKTQFNDKYSLDLIIKFLNSSTMDYYAKLTSYSIDGGYACYQKNFIERFGIPELQDEERDYVLSSPQEDVDTFIKNKYQLSC